MVTSFKYLIMAFKRIQTSIYFTAILTVFTTVSSCNNMDKQSNIHENTSTNIEAEKVAVKNTLIKMWAAIENKDIDTYASFVHPNFSQFGEYDSIIKLGKDTEVKGIANWIEDSDNIHTEMIDPIVIIREHVAWITYYWSDHGTTKGEPFASKGKSTRIFVKEDGNWLCIHGHYTLLPPPN